MFGFFKSKLKRIGPCVLIDASLITAVYPDPKESNVLVIRFAGMGVMNVSVIELDEGIEETVAALQKARNG